MKATMTASSRKAEVMAKVRSKISSEPRRRASFDCTSTSGRPANSACSAATTASTSCPGATNSPTAETRSSSHRVR